MAIYPSVGRHSNVGMTWVKSHVIHVQNTSKLEALKLSRSCSYILLHFREMIFPLVAIHTYAMDVLAILVYTLCI